MFSSNGTLISASAGEEGKGRSTHMDGRQKRQVNNSGKSDTSDRDAESTGRRAESTGERVKLEILTDETAHYT